MDDFHEGTRSNVDKCPKCHKPCIISTDLQKFGKHRIDYCLNCRLVWHNGEEAGPITMPEVV